MFLHTPGLTVLDLPLEVLHTRLHSADFLADVPAPQGPLRVHFPSG